MVYYKDNPDIDPYKMAYGLIPSQAVSCSDARQMYINRHFCYASKFAILTNGSGIVRHIAFIDDEDFKSSHSDLTVEKKTDSPDEDKSVGDASALVPVLKDFFARHPDFPDLHGILIQEMKVCLKKSATMLMIILPAQMILCLI